jgi:hypothetical protein
MGRYGKNAPPADFNWAWESSTCRPEIRSFLDLLEELLIKYKPGFFADFHAPGPGGYSYVVPPWGKRTLSSEAWRRVYLFIDLLDELTTERGSCRRVDLDPDYINWAGDTYRSWTGRALTEGYSFEGVPLESSYHMDGLGHYLYPDDWRFMGRQFCEAMRQIWFDNYDKADVSTVTQELLWDGWEMILLPRNVEVTAKPGEFCVESSGDKGAVSMSDFRQIACTEKGAYELSCEGDADMVCFACYNRGKKIAFKGRPYTLRLENEKILLPFDLFTLKDYDYFRLVFRVNSLKGMLKIEYGKL